jgi:formyl-CoA transferase
MGGPRDGPDMQNLHRNKRSMTLNLKLPEAREVLRAPGEDRRRGGGKLPAGRQIPPRHRLRVAGEDQSAIILASISGFGQDGPYRDGPGFDQIAQGMSGIMGVTGEPGKGRCAAAPRSPTSRRPVARSAS